MGVRPHLAFAVAIGALVLMVGDIGLGLYFVWKSQFVSTTPWRFLLIVYAALSGVVVALLTANRMLRATLRGFGVHGEGPEQSVDDLIANSVAALWRALNRLPVASTAIILLVAGAAYVLDVLWKALPPLNASSPVLVAGTGDNKRIYVASARAHAVLVFSSKNLKQLDPIPVGGQGALPATGQPQSMTFDPKRPFLYVADDQGMVRVVDIAKDHERSVIKSIEVGTAPRSVVITPDGRKLFVSNEQPIPAGSISVIDTSVTNVNEFNVIETVKKVGCPEGMAMSPDRQHLYVATQCAGAADPVLVIDTRSNQVINSIPGLAVGVGVAISPDGNTLFVARGNFPCRQPNGRAGSPLSVVDTRSKKIKSAICLNTSVNWVAVTHDGKYLAVGNGNYLSVFDARRVAREGEGALLKTVPLESAVGGIGVTEDDDSIFVWLPDTPRVFLDNLGVLKVK